MGEFDFIESVRRAFEGVGGGNGRDGMAGKSRRDRPAGSEACDGYLGIGDDCAVLPIGDGEAFVVTTDMLVEGVHFLRHGELSARGRREARELGGKALAVNLSDVAAMGARPVASFLSLALPADCQGEWADGFMEGYREMSVRHGVALAGGDTTASLCGVTVNVTAIGRAPLSHLKYRSGAQPGDIVVAGGTLGESAEGLNDIMAGRHDTPCAHIHRNPIPQVDQGEWLGGRKEVHSMIDLSDGMASDLRHILRASGVGAEIELESVPTPVSKETALTGGEDYKLLFTVEPEGFALLAEDYLKRFGAPLHPVGRIVEGPPEIVWLEGDKPVVIDFRGFVHF